MEAAAATATVLDGVRMMWRHLVAAAAVHEWQKRKVGVKKKIGVC
jgi:hypothetical protein